MVDDTRQFDWELTLWQIPRFPVLIAFSKGQTHYTDAIGHTFNILPLKAPPMDVDSVQPVLSVKFVKGQPFLAWAKAGMEALEIEVDRGNGFTLLTIDSHPGHLDTAPLPALGITAL